MDHQDWDTFYIQGNKELTNKKQNKKQIKPPSKEKQLEKKIEDGNLKHKRISSGTGKQIEKKRLELNMTRKDLAYKINLPLRNIDDIENGKAKYNPQHINKIKRILKINS